jgi:hypothetical protein
MGKGTKEKVRPSGQARVRALISIRRLSSRSWSMSLSVQVKRLFVYSVWLFRIWIYRTLIQSRRLDPSLPFDAFRSQVAASLGVGQTSGQSASLILKNVREGGKEVELDDRKWTVG